MNVILMLEIFSVSMVLGKRNCNWECSNIVQQVCAKVTAWDGTAIISRHHNICHMNKIKCRLKGIAKITQIPNEKCSDILLEDTRRLLDFGIVGAHQACNHSCPTYCVDTYEPVCAKVWYPDMQRSKYRTMVNHCHVDLFSCSVGVNVTIIPISSCFQNAAGLLFMSQMAAMKSLGFLEENHNRRSLDSGNTFQMSKDVKSDITESEIQTLLKRLYQSIIFKRLKKPFF